MSMRMTDILGYFILFALLGAIWVLFGEDPSKHQGGRGEIYFADFSTVSEKADRIIIKSPKGTLSLVKADSGWHVANGSSVGYPVNDAKVQAAFNALIRTKRVEPKTIDPDRFVHLELDDTVAVTVSIKGGDTELLSFKRGKISSRQGKALAYAYQASDTRAWLVRDMPTLSATLRDWIVQPVYTVNRADIKSLTLSDGSVIAQKDGTLTVADLKEGETAVAAFKLGEVMNRAALPKAVDILALKNPLSDPIASLTITRVGGDKVTLDIVEINGVQWIKSSAHKAGFLFRVSDQALADLLIKRRELVASPAQTTK